MSSLNIIKQKNIHKNDVLWEKITIVELNFA